MNPTERRLVRFGAALQALRVERGYSRAALARCAGMTDHELFRVERGEESPADLATVIGLARSLGVSIYALYANYDPTPQELLLEEMFAIEYGW